MDIMEERESQLRQSRLTVSKKPRLSLAGGEGLFSFFSLRLAIIDFNYNY